MRLLLLISIALIPFLFSCQEKQNLLLPDLFSEFLESIKDDPYELHENKRGVSIIVNRDQAREMGISTSQISSEIQKLMDGSEPYTLEEVLELDLQVRNFKGELIRIPFSTLIRIEYHDQ